VGEERAITIATCKKKYFIPGEKMILEMENVYFTARKKKRGETPHCPVTKEEAPCIRNNKEVGGSEERKEVLSIRRGRGVDLILLHGGP